MRPHALLRAALVVGFLIWVAVQYGYGLVTLLEPPARVRPPDTAALPPHQVNPRPDMGALPPTPPLSEPQAMETLRQSGYFNITAMTQQPDGSWIAAASRAANGAQMSVRIGRDGRVTPP
jgi:hypothetical protein